MTLRRRPCFMAFFPPAPARRGFPSTGRRHAEPGRRLRKSARAQTTAARRPATGKGERTARLRRCRPNRRAQPPARCRSPPPFPPVWRRGERCLKKPGSPMPKPTIACSLPRRSPSCAQPPPQRAQARPPRRRSFMLAELMQRAELCAVRRMQRRIEHRLPHVFRLRRLLIRLMMQRIKPGYRSHDPALFRPVNGPSVCKCR